MTDRTRAAVVLLSACLLAACSGGGPVSQATTLPSTPGPAAPSAGGGTGSPAPSAPASSPSPGASVVVTATGVPPKPGSPTFKLLSETPTDTGTVTDTYRITWTSPEGAAASFLVYGLTECLRYAKKYDGKPCVVRGMKIPADKLVLLGEVPGNARETTVSWDTGQEGPGPYAAILIRAKNPFGISIFTIVHSEPVCYACTY